MQDQLKILFGGFLLLLIGVVFIQEVANNEKGVTNLATINNESITMSSSGRSGETAEDDTTTLNFFGNATNNTRQASSLLVIGSTVNLSRNGSVAVAGLGFSNGPYNISYDYEGDLYVADNTSKTFVRLTTLFFAIFIVLGAVAVALKAYPELFSFK